MSASQQEASAAPDGEGEGERPRTAANDAGGPETPRSGPGKDLIEPTELFRNSLNDAEELLAYAARTGRFPPEPAGAEGTFKEWVIEGIVNARVAVESGGSKLTKDVASAFWASFADLSRIAHPVTATSLRDSKSSPIAGLKIWVLILALVLVLGSIYLFINNSISTQVAQLMEEQNNAALRLWSNAQYYKNVAGTQPDRSAAAPPFRLGQDQEQLTENRAYAAVAQPSVNGVVRTTPGELFAEVVEFSRKNHQLRETAWRLNYYFIPSRFRVSTEPIDFDIRNKEGLTRLNVSPDISEVHNIVYEALYQIRAYQNIRNFSQASYKDNTMLWSGVTTYLLPALYALLGATLYALRLYSELIQQRIYVRSAANSARYFIALIAGVVVGLFGSLLPPSASLPPLAIAFLVGYAVEAFFSRLDGFIKRVKGDEPTQPAAEKAA